MSDKVYDVTAEWAKRAHVDHKKYEDMYRRSVTDPNGFWSLNVAVPDDPSLVGATITAQLITSAAGGPVFGVGELTNAVEMVLGF